MNLNVQGVPQQAPYWCVPGSTEIILRTMGGYDPGQARLAQQEHTTSMGTWVGNAVNPLNQYQNNNEYQLITDTSDAADLLDEAVTDIYGYNSAVMLTINVSKTWYYPVGWSGNHAIVDDGYYLFFGGGHNTFDPEDQRMFGYTRGFYGPHSGTVAQVWRAVAANGNNIVW